MDTPIQSSKVQEQEALAGASPTPGESTPVEVELREAAFFEERFFLILSIFIGVFSGLAVVCFRISIEWTRILILGSGLNVTGPRLILAPAIAGLVIAFFVLHVFPSVRGSGVNQTKAALYIYDGYIPFRTAIGKFLLSALAIGSGHSLGPEDPSLQIGASLASALGRRLRLSREKLRLIAPIGAAAGLAAAFNAPISAVLFVIEEVIGRWTRRRPRLGRPLGRFERRCGSLVSRRGAAVPRTPGRLRPSDRVVRLRRARHLRRLCFDRLREIDSVRSARA